ncbi:hypothetical protein BH24ACT26_BH24ACT26_14560 [soil metagenome]
MRVLVVSDDPSVRDEAVFGFPLGFEVIFAMDSREASSHFQEELPAVVVVDMQTGNAGGYALMREMAETETLARIPTLILLQRKQDAWLATRAGATAYRTKPLGPGQLAREVVALTTTRP